jgi:hypothetical protein
MLSLYPTLLDLFIQLATITKPIHIDLPHLTRLRFLQIDTDPLFGPLFGLLRGTPRLRELSLAHIYGRDELESEIRFNDAEHDLYLPHLYKVRITAHARFICSFLKAISLHTPLLKKINIEVHTPVYRDAVFEHHNKIHKVFEAVSARWKAITGLHLPFAKLRWATDGIQYGDNIDVVIRTPSTIDPPSDITPELKFITDCESSRQSLALYKKHGLRVDHIIVYSIHEGGHKQLWKRKLGNIIHHLEFQKGRLTFSSCNNGLPGLEYWIRKHGLTELIITFSRCSKATWEDYAELKGSALGKRVHWSDHLYEKAVNIELL